MTPHYADDWLTVYGGDVRDVLPTLAADSVDCIVTSPPYWGLRDYGSDGQLGLERTPEEYVANMVAVFRELRRVLKPSGTCWLNLGDSYTRNRRDASRVTTGLNPKHGKLGALPDGTNRPAVRKSDATGLKPKDLVGIPWRVAFALQADGWYLRSDIIWAKPNPMPESRHRPADEGARVPVPADEVGAVLLRCGCGAGARCRRTRFNEHAGRNGSSAKGGKAADARGESDRRASQWCRARPNGSQHPLRLDHRHPPLSRCPLRRVPARAAGTLHQGGEQRAGRLPGVRGAVGAGGDD